jgi:hypothetical protein
MTSETQNKSNLLWKAKNAKDRKTHVHVRRLCKNVQKNTTSSKMQNETNANAKPINPCQATSETQNKSNLLWKAKNAKDRKTHVHIRRLCKNVEIFND